MPAKDHGAPSNKGMAPVDFGAHCKALATSLRKATADAKQLADDHEKVAQEGPKASF